MEWLGALFLGVSLGLLYSKYTAKHVKVYKLTASGDRKMVFVVRNDLGMGKGKIAAQCAHACQGLLRTLEGAADQALMHWERTGCKKVVVKCADESEMLRIAATADARQVPRYIVVDAGRTQVEPGSKTVLAIGPCADSELDGITNHLKLL